jgi:alkylated DNA repair dioxygenase AlkB
MFGDVVVSFSLLSDVSMHLAPQAPSRDVQGASVELNLKQRSMLILQDEARFKWTHEIKGRKSDSVAGVKRVRGRRVSVTFRNVKK